MQDHSIPSSPVYIRLTEFFFKCTKPSVYYTIVKVLIKKIHEFPDIYIEEIAYVANTTPASVTKFCKKIGYSSFKEMRTDLAPYSYKNPFSTIDWSNSPQNMIEAMKIEEQNLNEKIYELIDLEQCKRIAQKLASTTEIAVLCNTFNFASANILRELLSLKGITVFEINRKADISVIKQMLREVDRCFIFSLTGKWLTENPDVLMEIQQSETPTFLLTSQPEPFHAHIFEEIISLEAFNFLFYSNYYSQKVIHTILKVIANYLTLV
ncbi:hypothetical protein M5X00_15560 [Paenibacillus alvei]|uniref:HTH rpiR-type domain-containing protein n=1 Tax=Paenibacillus alvei TaxID=44250 RepID=A0ABT4GWI4_PAEAL|nr:MurR/RpiR family transcriptional regulator [Paenibacillus alvei]MCY9543568.1 hypothetical protein [Paenibacillus alvei]MCY9582855.1 hypothetical protein [Paenibacillus alvei]MCY9587915.1 hypothetical protein [Paenibacillus alvei]MCY9706848.1 hypothetical protein [Paenibacillus alvei]MCY9737669.1 hypothetical protein [Paenibacillus alvei]